MYLKEWGGLSNKSLIIETTTTRLDFHFRFFATGMKANPDIKLLAIEGVEPNPENISSGKYPFTASLYAITLKDNPNKKITPFLKWMQGPQGQEIVEKIGYIKN